MSRFAVVHEDPSYDEPELGEGWAELLDGFVTVAEKEKDEFSPYATSNS